MKTNVNGVEIAYEERGTGRPLILIHGFPFSRQMWQLQIPFLANACRVIAPDLRGFGESSGTPSTIDGLAEDVHALIESLSLPPVILAGFSMGGYVVFRYLARHADRVGAVMLLSTRAEADTPEGRERRYAGIERIKKEGPKAFVDEFVRALVSPRTLATPDLLAKVRRLTDSNRVDSVIGALKAIAERPDSTPLLTTIAVPTLIVAGEEDRVIPVDSARKMQAAIKGAKSVVISGAGHVANLEEPAQFTSTLQKFLRELSRT